MRYTLGQAARATGKGKTTIQRAILSGKLSADRNDDGSYAIDPAELDRVFPLVALERSETPAVERDATHDETVAELATLRERVAQLEERLHERDDRIRAAEAVSSRLMEQNERLLLMLNAPRETPHETPSTVPSVAPVEQPVAQPETPARPWWRRLFGE